MTIDIEDMSRLNHKAFCIFLIVIRIRGFCVFYSLCSCAVVKAIMGKRVALVDLVRHAGAICVAVTCLIIILTAL